MADPVFEELARVYSDRYDVTANEAGRIVLEPKLTAEAARLRLGGRPLTDEEFQQDFGDLPTGPL